MNLDKLTPAPWDADGCRVEGGDLHSETNPWIIIYDEGGHNADEAEFIALARNAFDVMMRRGWEVERFSLLGGGYAWRLSLATANDMIRQHGANAADFKKFASLHKAADPFTALVEADKWYKENVEHERQRVS